MKSKTKTHTIKKGFHRPLSLIPACIKGMSRKPYQEYRKTIRFTPSCRYLLSKEDQTDWNKLFGFCFGIRGVHRDSARFAWRYNFDHDTIEIAAYKYVDGFRTWNKIKEIHVGKEHTFEITRQADGLVAFYIDGIFLHYDYIDQNDKTAYGCGLYFGGNNRAPHDIEIIEQKAKRIV